MIEKIKEKIYKAKGQRQTLRNEYVELKDKLRKYKKELNKILKAQLIIKLVAKQTQEQLEYSLSEIVSLGMGIVFDKPFSLSLDFEPKKCFIKFKKEGRKFDPMLSAGGGTGNIAATNLRCAIQKISQPRTRNFLFLDEPLPGLKGKEANARALEMLKTISEELDDMQIIMISDERVDKETILKYADKVFETELIDDKYTVIKEI